MFCDSSGYLYFTTMGGGVSVFNGKKMKTLNKKQGLHHLTVRACSDGPANKIYFGTFGGAIYRYDTDSVTLITDSVFKTDVFTMCYYKHLLWIGAGNGLYTWNGKKFENVTKKYQLPEYAVTFLRKGSDGSLWFGYDENYGLYNLKGNDLKIFNEKNGLTKGRLLNCFEDSKGRVWISAFDGVYKIERGKTYAEKEQHEWLPKYYAFEMTEQDGKLIIGATEGIYIYDADKKSVRFIGDKNGLAWKGVFRMMKDLEGNIWISNWGKGVARWVQSGLVEYDEASGIEKPFQSGFYEENGTLYVAGRNNIYKSEGDKFIKEKEHYTPDIITAFFLSPTDKWLAFPTYFTHVVNGKEKDYKIDSLQGVRKFIKDKDGSIWACGWTCGVFKIVNGEIKGVNDPLASSMKYYYTGFLDSKGRLWLGSGGGGIIRYDGNNWKQISEKDGLPSERVTAFAEDETGNIYAGTSDAGVVLIDKSDIVNPLIGEHYNIMNSVNSLLWHNGYLWAGGIGKVQRLKLNFNRAVSEAHWGDEEGFNADCTIDGMYAGKSKVFIATTKFLFAVDENLRREPDPLIKVHIEKITVKEKPLSQASEIRLKYNMNRIAFTFLSTRMQGNTEVMYYYRMKGIDTNFIYTNGDNEVIFHELHPGSYTFEAKAYKEGHWSRPATFSFTILPPFWQTWWFYLLCALSIAGIIFYYIRRRERKLKEDKIRLEQVVEIRTSEISKQKKIIEQKQKETIDSIRYAKRIQNAFLPSEKYIDKNLKSKGDKS